MMKVQRIEEILEHIDRTGSIPRWLTPAGLKSLCILALNKQKQMSESEGD